MASRWFPGWLRWSVGLLVGVVVVTGLWLFQDYPEIRRHERYTQSLLDDLDERVGLTAWAPGEVEIGKGRVGKRSAGSGSLLCSQFFTRRAFRLEGGGFDPVVLANRMADVYEAEGWEVVRIESYRRTDHSGPVSYRWVTAGLGEDSVRASFYETHVEAGAKTHSCEIRYSGWSLDSFDLEVDEFVD